MNVLWVLILGSFLLSSCFLFALVVLIKSIRKHQRQEILMQLFRMFSVPITQAQADPKVLARWSELSVQMRGLFPDIFRKVEASSGVPFPFSFELIESAHAKWTSDWLAWERKHDLEYKERIRAVESELNKVSESISDETSALRSRLNAIELEKLGRYQERYEEYVRVGKTIAELKDSVSTAPQIPKQ